MYAEPFLVPVDPDALKIPDYFDFVKEPMDLSTVDAKLKRGEYETPLQFGRDMRLIWQNALLYNPKNSSMHKFTLEIKAAFEKEFAKIEESPNNDAYPSISNKTKKYEHKMEQLTAPKDPTERSMTLQEKKLLSSSIQRMP